jgi:hypothetical protein
MPPKKSPVSKKEKQALDAAEKFYRRDPSYKKPGQEKKKKKPTGTKGKKGKPARTEKPGVPHGVDKKTQEGAPILEVAKGGSVSKFGMLSVKAGIDNNPNPTQADRIAGATKKMKRGGAVDTPKKKRGNYGPNIGKPFKAMGPVGGLPVNKAGTKIMAGRLAKRGYGKARK